MQFTFMCMWRMPQKKEMMVKKKKGKRNAIALRQYLICSLVHVIIHFMPKTHTHTHKVKAKAKEINQQ